MTSSRNIPFIDVARSVAAIWDEAGPRIQKLALAAEFISGSSVKEFEALLSTSVEVSQSVACANGTDAIILALQAAGIGRGHRVAVPNLTFWATYEAVIHVGATPVLIDVSETHLQIDMSELFKAHEREPLDACVVAHLFGWCHPELLRLRRLCKDKGIVLIEDGAQAFGVTIANETGAQESVFKNAEIATLSFYPSKVLGGCMDGGAVTTNSPEYAAKVRSLLNHGRRDHYSYDLVGWNSRMSGFQGAYLSVAIAHANAWIQERRRLLRRYQGSLKHRHARWVLPPDNVVGNGYLAVLRLPVGEAARVQEDLLRKGIGTGRVYPETIHQQHPAHGAERHTELAASINFTRQVLNLPLFPGLSPSEQDVVIDALLNAVD